MSEDFLKEIDDKDVSILLAIKFLYEEYPSSISYMDISWYLHNKEFDFNAYYPFDKEFHSLEYSVRARLNKLSKLKLVTRVKVHGLYLYNNSKVLDSFLSSLVPV